MGGDKTNYVPPSCGHDPRRCCANCCPAEEEGRGENGGGCNVCHGALALPRVDEDEGMNAVNARELVTIIADEVQDQDFARLLREVLDQV